MGPASRLLVVEALLPERATEQPAVIRMDLHMLVLLGARERTEAQYRGLLASAGFRVARVVPTASPAGLSAANVAGRGTKCRCAARGARGGMWRRRGRSPTTSPA